MSTITEKRNLNAELEAAFLKSGLGSNPERKKAFDSFLVNGLPVSKTEEYKFAPISRILDKVFQKETATTTTTKNVSSSPLIPGLKSNVIAFVNGRYSKDQSVILDAKLSVRESEEVKAENHEADPFALLNHAFHSSHIEIGVAAKAKLEHPLSIVYLFDASEFIFANPKWTLRIGTQGSATLLEYSIGQEQPYFNNKRSYIEVGENAFFEYAFIQNGPASEILVNNSEVYAAPSSQISCITCTLDGLLIRNNLSVIIDGQNVDAHLYGLYLLSKNTIADNHTVVDHRKPNSYSNELYKGVMNGNSRGVFNGKIYVRPDAQKTNAFQSNRNILLSETATVNTKPQLEIWADDVKCSHGCTTGQLDEEALFYLRSRGLSKEMAKGLLLHAFASEVILPVRHEAIRKFLDELITERSVAGF